MLTVWQGNRLETLADRLAAVLREPLASALTPDVVVVQNTGMARWLSLHLARALGVCANVRFRLPAAFLWETYRAVVPDASDTSAVEPDVATWHLMALLDEVGDEARFEPVRRYLGDGTDDRKRYELARRLADTFEQYQVYRPEWIAAWEAGDDAGWQPELWRRLVGRGVRHHRAAMHGELLAALGRAPIERLPPRVSLFGIPALAPAYLDVFQQLGELVDLRLYLLNPCREYWGDVMPARDAARVARDRDPAAMLLVSGNDLLASMGKQGRDFLDRVTALGGVHDEAFEAPAGQGMLAVVQGDILALRNPQPTTPTLAVAASDRSIQVHACHSPMREVEVLHDQLLALFDATPALRPSDVVVMTPDIEGYAPCIEAVFGAAAQIPFTIADRSRRAESPLIEAFFGLLELPDSRWEAARLLALLDAAALRRRFGVEATDLPVLQDWVRNAGIRWGIDAAGRAAVDLPATNEHTWRFGLDRLLLGHALADDPPALFADVLPCADVEGTRAAVLGQLLAFTDAAFALDGELTTPRSLGAWSTTLGALLARFFDPDDEEEADAQAVRDALLAMADAATAAAFDTPVALPLVQAHLRRLLDVDAPRGRFLAGRVTFCAMVPMRSIPFEVVCLLGLDVSSFPRTRRPPGFDLMAKEPRRGDRSRRDDDRYLFLEALVSARRAFYVSYVGRSIRDNTEIPPSVLVSELFDYLHRRFTAPDGGSVVERHVRVVHPLQPFSRAYFGGGDGTLFSYSAPLCDASRALRRGEGRTSAALCGERLAEPDAGMRIVTPDQLVRFFRNPTQYFLTQRLQMRLAEAAGVLEAREPFRVEGLERYGLRNEMLALRLDAAAADPYVLVRAGGALPHGEVGRAVYRGERAAVDAFAARVTAALGDAPRTAVPIHLATTPVEVHGPLRGLAPDGLVDFRLAKTKARDLLSLWIRHLLLACAAPEGIALRSLWIGDDSTVELGAVADPAAALQPLLDCYWEGLRRPLHFFPESAFVYCAEDGLPDARDCWEGDDYGFVRGEGEDPYYRAAFRDTDPLDDEFERLAVLVYRPLLAARPAS